MSDEDRGFVKHTRRVSTGEYEHIEEEVKLPLERGTVTESKKKLRQAADVADTEAERRSGKLVLPESKKKGETVMEREDWGDESDE